MPEVFGQHYQHATVKPTIIATGATMELRTFSKLSFKAKAEKQHTHNAEGAIDGFTIKQEERECSIALKLSEWFALREFLIGQNPTLGVLQCQFDLPVVCGEGINEIKVYSLRGVMVQEDGFDSSDSQDAIMVEIPLFVSLGIDFPDGPAFRFTSS